MAEKFFNLSILAPYGKIYEGEVTSIVAPGGVGYLGILYNHAPLVTTLQAGKFMLKDIKGLEEKFLVKGDGFLEVLNNKVTVLVKGIEKSADV